MIIMKVLCILWLMMLSLYLGFSWGYNVGRNDKEEDEK